jgi:hypothetical protein
MKDTELREVLIRSGIVKQKRYTFSGGSFLSPADCQLVENLMQLSNILE